MTELDQVAAVAELDGKARLYEDSVARYKPQFKPLEWLRICGIDYSTRDAIIAVIEKQELKIQYCTEYWLKERFRLAFIWKSTAAQFTEALLRATGKWKN